MPPANGQPSGANASTKQPAGTQQPAVSGQSVCRKDKAMPGSCPYGKKCKFKHQIAQEPSKSGNANKHAATKASQPQGGVTRAQPTNSSASQQASTSQIHVTSTPTPNAESKTRYCWKDQAQPGSCRFGSQCNFKHRDPGDQAPASPQPLDTPISETPTITSSVMDATRRRKEEAAELQRNLNRDAQQRKKELQAAREIEEQQRQQTLQQQAHEAEEARKAAEVVREQEVALKREKQAKKAQEARERKAKKAQEARELQARKEQEEREAEERRKALLEQRHQDYASATWGYLALQSTLVTFGAGLIPLTVVPGFDCCHARVRRLPARMTPHDLVQLVKNAGIPAESFYVLDMTRQGDSQQATLLIDATVKDNLVRLVANAEVQDESAEGGADTWNRGTIQVTLSWPVSSTAYTVEFPDATQAFVASRRLNQQNCHGRRLTVGLVPSPVQTNYVSVKNLPGWFEDSDVRALTGDDTIVSLQQRTGGKYDRDASEQLAEVLRGHGVTASDAFEYNGFSKIRVHFATRELAQTFHGAMNNRRFAFLDNQLMRSTAPSFRYSITIPTQQYEAQRTVWNDLPKHDYKKGGGSLGVEISVREVRTHVRVIGKDTVDAGPLKIRVEKIVRGQTVEGWTRQWLSPKDKAFMKTVETSTSTVIRWDYKALAMRVYGNSRTSEQALAMFKAEMDKESEQEVSVPLQRQNVAFFMRQGLQALKDMYEDENVRLLPPSSAHQPFRIIIQGGGDEARHAVNRLIRESIDAPSTTSTTSNAESTTTDCPICFVEVAAPVRMAGCEHSYCNNCARHCLSSASETKQFPLLCVGNGGTCGMPISIPIIQQFLLPQSFNELLEAAFSHHIERHQQEYRYCSTADCAQIYRCNPDSTTAVKCPSCLAFTCPACHESGHDGLPCGYARGETEARLTEDFALAQGFQRCPECNVLIEKTEGCNHVACRCGAHLCWICRGVFTPQTIYTHMSAAHGGYYQERPVPAPRAEAAGPARAPATRPVQHEFPFELVDDYAAQANALNMFNRQAGAQRQGQGHPLDGEAERALRTQAMNRARAQLDRIAQERRDEADRLQRIRATYVTATRTEDAAAFARTQAAQRQQLELNRREREREREQRERGWCTIM